MPRPIAVTVNPTATDANGITTTQTLAAGDLEFLQNGALASGLDRDGIATAQTPGSASNLTLDGALGVTFATPTRVSVYGANDESGKTFTVTGLGDDGGHLIEVITGPNATTVMGATEFKQITTIAASAATTGDVEVGVNGTTTFTQPQHVTITSAGDDTGDTFTVTGTDRQGLALTEGITGANAGVAAGTKNFKTVTKVASSGASAAGVTVGVDGTAESQWIPVGAYGGDFTIGLGVEQTDTATWDVEHTFDDVLVKGFVEADATVYNHDSLAAQSANADGNYAAPPVACRLAITAHTSGSVTLNIIQASHRS
jgi:hypothetical protein|tara:strand:+ start:17104 stop:18045 length:942 start_codon:yes stop_codon:yes gene_type:complete